MPPRARHLRLHQIAAAAAMLATTAVAALGDAQTAPPPPTSSIEAAPIKEAIAHLAADVARWGGTVGVQITDVDTGNVIASLAEHRPFNPASNAKLITAAAALRLLGPQHRFHTGLYGQIAGYTIDQLVLRGDGDPTLRTADLWTMATELHAAGVRRIRAILVDQSFFDDHYVPPAFDQQPQEWAHFRAPVAPVSLNENTLTFSVRATRAGSPALVNVDPPGFIEPLTAVTTTRKGTPEKLTVTMETRGPKLTARLSGSIPEAGRVVRIARRVDDPRLLAAHTLRALLEQAGIHVATEPKLGGTKAKTLLVSHRSPPLGELITALGKESDNFCAEMLFKAIAAKTKGRPATADDASDVVRQAIEALGASEPGLVIKNGSGLFDADRTTPAATTALLRTMARDPLAGPEYIAQLSIGGVDGTLRHRFRDWADTHTVRAKTGTLDAVAALSGYIIGPPGRSTLAFSILVNGISGKVGAARPSMDRIVEAATREVWKQTPGRGGP